MYIQPVPSNYTQEHELLIATLSYCILSDTADKWFAEYDSGGEHWYPVSVTQAGLCE